MEPIQSFQQDPTDDLDYSFDWTSWLATGETITTATVTADDGLTIHDESNTTSVVTFWASGGTANGRYAVHCHVTTSEGREATRSLFLSVIPR